MAEDKIILTITGEDKPGIVAKISTALYELNVNIEDIKQTIMQDCFCMIMLCNIGKSDKTFTEIKNRITEAANSLDMTVWVQRKEIFDRMHTI